MTAWVRPGNPAAAHKTGLLPISLSSSPRTSVSDLAAARRKDVVKDWALDVGRPLGTSENASRTLHARYQRDMVERAPATGASLVAGGTGSPRGTIYQADKIESAYIPMSLRLGSTANVVLPARLSPLICRLGYLTDYRGYMVRLIPSRMVDRIVGEVLECVTTLGHKIIGRPGFRVPKSAAAQGDSRRRASYLVVATEGALVAPQALLLGERRPPIVRVAPPPKPRPRWSPGIPTTGRPLAGVSGDIGHPSCERRASLRMCRAILGSNGIGIRRGTPFYGRPRPGEAQGGGQLNAPPGSP
jgi:hypothetical protein